MRFKSVMGLFLRYKGKIILQNDVGRFIAATSGLRFQWGLSLNEPQSGKRQPLKETRKVFAAFFQEQPFKGFIHPCVGWNDACALEDGMGYQLMQTFACGCLPVGAFACRFGYEQLISFGYEVYKHFHPFFNGEVSTQVIERMKYPLRPVTLATSDNSNSVRNLRTVLRCQFQCLASPLTVNATCPCGKGLAMAGNSFLSLVERSNKLRNAASFECFSFDSGLRNASNPLSIRMRHLAAFSSFILGAVLSVILFN